MEGNKGPPKAIEVQGVECTLVKSCEWADFYVGDRPVKGKIRVRVSKRMDKSFFIKYSPHDFTSKDLLSIIMSYLPAAYDDLPEEWKAIMEYAYNQRY